MTWNLMDMDLFDGEGFSRVPWQLDAEKGIADTIREVDPDILLIVEAPSFTELEGFINRNALDYRVVHLRQQAGRRSYADSMALLSRARVDAVSLETPPVPGSQRTPQTAYLDWSYRGLLLAGYGELTVIGVHLKSPWDGKQRSYEIRDAQARGLLDFIRGIDGPLLVLGDFNDSPGRDEKERAYGIPDTLGLIGEILERSPGDEVTQKKGFNLDHIFIRGGHPEARRIEETGWILSDHRPVWTEIHF
jgi:endonuclease/exonuclease/phosphatase (EEP) superfamily protein YafD